MPEDCPNTIADEPMRFGLSPRVLIRDATGRALLLRRTDNAGHWPGFWELPGGKPEPGESFDRAAVREAKEETGLDVRLIDVVGTDRDDQDYPDGTLRIIYLVLSAGIVSGELSLSDEHDAACWAGSGDLTAMRVIDAHKRVLQAVLT